MAGKKVLVVDDEAAILKVVAKRLETAGFAVSVAMDGEAALAHVRRDPPGGQGHHPPAALEAQHRSRVPERDSERRQLRQRHGRVDRRDDRQRGSRHVDDDGNGASHRLHDQHGRGDGRRSVRSQLDAQ